MTDVPNVRQQGTRLGNWLTRDQAKQLLAIPDRATITGKRNYCPCSFGRLCSASKRAVHAHARRHSAPRGSLGHRGLGWQRWPSAVGGHSGVGKTGHQRLADRSPNRRGSSPASALKEWSHPGGRVGRLGNLECGRGLRERDWDRAFWGARSAEDLREALQKEWRRPGANQISPRALVDTNHGAVPGIGTRDRNRGERQFGIMKWPARRSKLVRTACYRIYKCVGK